MKNTFTFTLKTPEGEVFSGELRSVAFSSEGGDMQCFAGHASLTATIAFSPVLLEAEEGHEERFLVRNGVFLFDNKANKASLLALSAEKESEVNLQSTKDYLAFVEKQLAEGKELSSLQVAYLEGEKLAVQQMVESAE